MTARALTFQRFRAFDSQLGSLGFPRCSPWWLEQAERFLDHATAKAWVARVGRGGIKSTMIAKLALAVVLFGKFKVPPGERHYFTIVSVSKDEASQRLRLIEGYARALGVRYVRAGDDFLLDDRPLGIKVLPATIAGTSGFRAVGFACDELAKWRSVDDGANPAAEVASSLRAMTVTHASSLALYFSSPLGAADYHSKLVDAGDTARQVVSEAPTWLANPSVTEAQTRELEPDDRVWRREYLAVPQAGALSAFEPEDVLRAFVHVEDVARTFRPLGVIDASSGKKDRFTSAHARWCERVGGARVLAFDEVRGLEAAELRKIGGDAAVLRIATTAKAARISTIVGDQREGMMLKDAFARCGVLFRELAWTSASKPRAVARLRRWLIDGRLALPPHDALKRELLSFEERITPGGDFTFGARGNGHDDFVSLLITIAMADEARLLTGAPQRGDDGESQRAWHGATPSAAAAAFGGAASPAADPLDRVVVTPGGRVVLGERAASAYSFSHRDGGSGGGF